MMADFFLGIDAGGTAVKAAVFSASGEEVGVAARTPRFLSPHAGHAERDPEEMWRHVGEAVPRALASAGGPGPNGASVLGSSGLRLPLGSLGGALATMEVDAALAEAMHAARAPAQSASVGFGEGVAAAAFSQHPLHGKGWNAAHDVAGVRGMGLNAR